MLSNIKVIKTFAKFNEGLTPTELKTIEKQLKKMSYISISEVDEILEKLEKGLNDYEMEIGEILKDKFNLKGSTNDIINTYLRSDELRYAVFDLMIDNIILNKTEIVDEFRDVFSFNKTNLDLSNDEIIHVIIEWYIEKNKLYGMFNMDVRNIIINDITISDTGPKGEIYTDILNFQNIKKKIQNPSYKFRYEI